MSFPIKQQGILRASRRPRAWSVSFSMAGKTGTREDAATGLVAGVSVDGTVVRNDFDRIPIFQRPIFNATWDRVSRQWIRLTPLGEAGFTWSPTEPYREVVYRCQPFWYKLDMEATYAPCRVSVTDRPLSGYTLAPMFKNGSDFVYRPCFELALGEDGLPHSRAGLMPLRTDGVALMEKARAYDSTARTESVKDWFSDVLLMLVEFARWDMYTLMSGNAATAPVETGGALRRVAATSGYAEKDQPCVWRGKENPWRNVNSTLCDLMLRRVTSAGGNRLELCYLPDVALYDGTLNQHYRTLGDYISHSSGVTEICGFAEKFGFIYPSLPRTTGVASKGASYLFADYASDKPIVVAVGGNSSTYMLNNTTIAPFPTSFECVDLSNWRAAYCGARLVLEEGGQR